jgi:hypothetical protein
MSMGAANDFKTNLIEFIDYHSSLGESYLVFFLNILYFELYKYKDRHMVK